MKGRQAGARRASHRRSRCADPRRPSRYAIHKPTQCKGTLDNASRASAHPRIYSESKVSGALARRVGIKCGGYGQLCGLERTREKILAVWGEE